MPDALVWVFIVLFVLIPVIGFVVLWPIYLYNIAWRVFNQKEPIIPVYVVSSPNAINGYTLYTLLAVTLKGVPSGALNPCTGRRLKRSCFSGMVFCDA
ncbi:MAG TPA: hypothetical protein VF329_00070 [Gammaproteobacteria bacterium]